MRKKGIIRRIWERYQVQHIPQSRLEAAVEAANKQDFKEARESTRKAMGAIIRRDYICDNDKTIFNLSKYVKRESGLCDELIRTSGRIEQKLMELLVSPVGKMLLFNGDVERLKYKILMARSLKKQAEAIIDISYGHVDNADKILEQTCNMGPFMYNSLFYAEFLELSGTFNTQYRKKSSAYWEDIATRFFTDFKAFNSDGNIIEMEDSEVYLSRSRNELMELEISPSSKDLIVIKRSKDKCGIEKEYHASKFIYSIMGKDGIVPEPLGFTDGIEYAYFIQRRVQGETLLQAIQSKRNIPRIIADFSATLCRYQEAITSNRDKACNHGFEIPTLDYSKEFHSKFIQRMDERLPISCETLLQDNISATFTELQKQLYGGCHGDMHAENCLYTESGSTYIIDPEKMFWGARLLDYAHFFIHTKIEHGIDLEAYIADALEQLMPKISGDERVTSYNIARLYKAPMMAATVQKYMSAGGADNAIMEIRIRGYISETMSALNHLTDNAPANYRQNIRNLSEIFSRIHQSMSA